MLATEFLCQSEPCLVGFNRSKMYCFADPYPGCMPGSSCGRLVLFFITACKANLCMGPRPALVTTLLPHGLPPQPGQGRPSTLRRQSEPFNPEIGHVFGLEWWGPTRAQQAYLVPNRFWGSAPPGQKARVLLRYFRPNWKGRSARFCPGGLPRAASISAVVPGGLAWPAPCLSHRSTAMTVP